MNESFVIKAKNKWMNINNQSIHPFPLWVIIVIYFLLLIMPTTNGKSARNMAPTRCVSR